MTRLVMITKKQDARLEKLAPEPLRGPNRASQRVQIALNQFMATLDPKFVPEGGDVYVPVPSEN